MKTKTSQTSLDKALIESANAGDVDRVKDSLIAGADIHAQEDFALRWAALEGRSEVVRFLLDNGADIHSQDDGALFLAAEKGHSDIAMLLIARGADLEVGIEAAKERADPWMLELLTKIKRSREEKDMLLAEVPVPERAAGRNRI